MTIRKCCFLAVAFTLALAGCQHYATVNDVIAPGPEIVAIDMVLPHAPGFRLTGRTTLDPIVSLLRRECNWTEAESGSVENQGKRVAGYRLVMYRSNGSHEEIDVVKGRLRKGRYQCRLSSRKAANLEDLCGLATVHLGTFAGAMD